MIALLDRATVRRCDPSVATSARCQDCGATFDRDDPSFTLAQLVWNHEYGEGHAVWFLREAEGVLA